jgi:hypothetical protein
MPKITFPSGTTIELSLSDFITLCDIIKQWYPYRKNKYLNYQTSYIEKEYSMTQMNWVEIRSEKEQVRAPYELVIDYRSWPKDKSWGYVDYIGEYSFPGELSDHKELMIKSFKREGKLQKGNNAMPRVKKVEFSKNGIPTFYIQRAYYHDQIGTNLSLDFQNYDSKEFLYKNKLAKTVRDWDRLQCGISNRKLPKLEQSVLANTIGVAIGISALNQEGFRVFLRRKRTNKVAVYPGMWHVPVSFALTPNDLKAKKKKLQDYIQYDLAAEITEEAGLEPTDLSPIRPIAFCRDLVRGGKPQFFFEMEATIPFEEIRRKIKDKTGEYNNTLWHAKEVNIRKKGERGFSPELLAYTMLISTRR